jgi:hypothetical protein
MFRKLGLLALTFAVGLTLAGCGASTIWAEGTLDNGAAALTPMAMDNFANTGQLIANPGSMGTLSSAGATILARAGLDQQETISCDSGSYTVDTQNGADFVSYDDCRFNLDDGSYFLYNGAFWEQYGSGEDFHVWTEPELEFEAFNASNVLELGLYMDADAELTANGGGAYALDYFFDMELSDGSDTFSMFFDMTYAYVPDSSANPMAAGTITFDGDMRFRDAEFEYNLAMATDEPLHHTDGCIDSGAATYSDESGVLRIVANACNDYTATFEGTGSAPTTIAHWNQ